MKNLINKGILPLAGSLLVLGACTKNIEDKTPRNSDVGTYASVQVYNAAVGTARNFIYMDGVPLNGTPMAYTSAAFTGSGTTYGLAPGVHNFTIKDTSSTTTQAPLTFSNSFQPNTSYTIFTYDTLTAVKQITVQTTLEVPMDTTARVRFAHLSFLTSGTPDNVDIYSRVRKANIFSNVAFKTVTNFIPMASGKADTLLVRPAGTTNDFATLIVTFARKRSYTLVFRGRYANATISTEFPRTLTSFVN
jgi:hypothetical protein